MDWTDIAIVLVGIAFVGWLLHAANVIGRNPYLRVKAHEELLGQRLPSRLSMEEKQALLDRRGLAPRSAGRIVLYILIVAALVVILLWLRQQT